ncbi:MAG: hypothetical protein Kapaf2KO_16460 [Candidatus Kapaibacteriales bacterium]
MIDEVKSSTILDFWQKDIMQKMYALILSFGSIAVLVGIWGAYEQTNFVLVYSLIAVYISGAFIFLLEYKNYILSVNLFIFYFFFLGTILLATATDSMYGILWIFGAPILGALFHGTLVGLLLLVLSCTIVGTMLGFSIIDAVPWDIGVETGFVSSWLAMILNMALLDLLFIFAFGSLTRSYTKAILEKERSAEELVDEKEKLLHSKLLLEQEIKHAQMIEKEKLSKEDQFKAIFDFAHEMYLIFNESGDLIELNNETSKITGWEKERLIKDNAAAKASNLFLGNDIKNSLSNGDTVLKEEKIFTKEGIPIPVELHAKTISLNNVNHTLCIMRDISHLLESRKKEEEANKELQKKVLERTSQFEDAMSELRQEIKIRLNIEKEMKRAKRTLEDNLTEEKKLSELKTRFVSMVSHEYRTPLTIIFTSADVLEYLYEKQDKLLFQKNLDRIKASVNSMVSLLEDVLLAGKNEYSMIEKNIESVTLPNMLEEIIEEVKVGKNSDYDISLKVDKSITEINTDKVLLKHIIRNFLTNAQKYSDEKDEIEVSAKFRNSDKRVDIAVIDKGIGVPKDDIDSLFEPFFRSGNVEARSGTGLGLSICKSYADALDAEIYVDSEEGKGSIFGILLPVYPNGIL